ncbi:YopX family protein [Streptococcus pneumoniae]|nr:YopX family protein [Streptococcus pneumoniae]MDS5271331.1 YopX family protein [Streptococcus pneumoniae]MDS7992399.1 YopX family protein [Streptococcus pneumoniae]
MIQRYRAWHRELGRMMLIKNMWFQDGSVEELELNDTVMNDYITAYPDEIELMQSTELFDKNNKEIFEGDIVLVLGSLYTVFYDNERGSYRLKPHDDRWNVDYMSNFAHSGNFEVVGNIYENKELL